ncbi:tetratricopeptide repeat-containing protein [Novosphingobium sp.]|uniref:tetratricopeptide repeat-containing protein n=1 Tax=Novosphingobium sp. TaxID=1874826 RepID=UPI00273421E4|nr:tetratricopeptide repeat-containing protein [Novosphingobium sp.]MDP3907704.1 hypothetical protein [Novosphingobium sp.]
MTAPATLPAITALARAGAIERAWDLFLTAGHAARTADPAALAVKGRLLKDKARSGPIPDRALGFAAAAEAYSAAHALAPAPYLAINAATLRLLAGDRGGAQFGARETLRLLDTAQPAADTPYYLAATRAEALLLLDDQTGAQAALEAAVRHDPDGWEDRAVTLAQLRAILQTRHAPLDWLTRFNPPASLHFAGHMGVQADGTSEAAIGAAVDALLAQHRIGFAWGALAAGADIVIAEHLLRAGTEVHVVLPCPLAQFAAQSVAPAGSAWLSRHEAVLAQARSVVVAGQTAAAAHDPLATAHAGELAIGGAILNARRLGAAARQLIITDEAGGGHNTARQAVLWPSAAGPQDRLTVPRDAEIDALFPPEQPDPARALTVSLCILLDGLDDRAALDSGEIAALNAPVADALRWLDPADIRAAPGRWDIRLTDLDAALDAVCRVLGAKRKAGTLPPAIGVHIAIATSVADPASGALVPYGPGPALARRLAGLAHPGLALASQALAVTMAARATSTGQARLYHFGDETTEGAVFALSQGPA